MVVPLANWMKKDCFICVQEALAEKNAKSLLLHAFASDILEHIKPANLSANMLTN